VIIATSGEETIAKVKLEKPEIILLDIEMPGVDGIQTLEEIRQMDKDAMIMLASGVITKEFIHKITKAGANDYMAKPLDLDALKKNLRSWARAIEVKRLEKIELLGLDYDEQKIKTLLEVFRKEGYIVRAIEDRNSGLDAIEGPFELLFIRADILKNDTPGVLERYKKVYPELPVLIAIDSGAKKDEWINSLERLGSYGYLPPEFNLHDIIAAVYGMVTKAKEKIKIKRENSLSDYIFVVDDEPLLCKCISEFLRKEGYNAYSITDSKAVLNEVAALKPFLVFMDLVMPGVDGLELLRKIKKIEPNICVIMMTGVKDDSVCREAIESGASDYLVKPFSLDQVKATALTYSIKSRQDECTRKRE